MRFLRTLRTAYSRKPSTWSESVWRGYRSFWQTLAPGLAGWLMAVASTHGWALDILLFAAAVPSVSAAFAMWSNREKAADEGSAS